MKITNVKTYLIYPVTKSGLTVSKNLLFVKVETDEGIDGWGESFTMLDRERVIAQQVTDLSRYVIGRNPFQIKDFTQMAFKIAEGRGSVEFFSAMSGIEIALWDIVGKKLEVPVYNLLGGSCRETIKVYANGWTRGAQSPQELAERALMVIEQGFTAVKFYPFPFSKSGDLKAATENVKAVREAVGPDIDILIDVWRRPEPSATIRFAEMLRELEIYWYEEPVPSDNIDILAKVRNAVSFPVVTGECLYTKHDFREVFEKQAADIINPDVASCGGILQMKELAAMAEPYYVLMAPHNYNSTAVSLAATIQIAATIPNFLIAEYFITFSEVSETFVKQPFKVQNSHISLTKKSGLGLEIDEDALKDYPYQEFPLRKW